MKTTTQTHPGTVIHEQIGRRAFYMMGARDLILVEGGLLFGVGGARYRGKAVNKIRISLASDDTYTVEAWYVRGANITTRATLSGVYAEQLHATLKALTGFAMSL